VTDETAEFIQSPTPDGWIVIADAIPVGPPVPPTGIWASTEAKDEFTHNGNYTSIGIASPGGWVGAVETFGPWHSTDNPDRFTGAPAQAPYDGIGWLGWVPAFCTWHSTDNRDQATNFYGWIVGFGITGQMKAIGAKDRFAFSNRTTTVTGTWGSVEAPDRWASAGILIPLKSVQPRPPIKRRLLIVT